jgi:hypothetical protein
MTSYDKTFSVTVTAEVVDPPPGESPEWFTAANLPYYEWHPVAAGSTRVDLAAWQRGPRIIDQISPPPWYGNQNDIVETGNGAAIDQENLEMFLVACGGHAARQTNDSFSFQADLPVPGWRRLTDPTPYEDLAWHFGKGDLPTARTWRDAWLPNTAYVGFATSTTANPADVVRVGNECYVCRASHTSGSTFDPTNWSLEVADAEAYQYWSRTQVLAPGNGVPASCSRTWNVPSGGTPVDIRYYPACAGDGAISTGDKSRQRWTPWGISSLNDINDRPRSMHTGYTQWYANGKVWFPLQNSITAGTGFSMNITMSFDVDAVRSGTIPRPFVAGRDVWDYHQSVPELSTTGNLFGATALDSSTGKIWYHVGNYGDIIALDTNTGLYTSLNDPNPNANACLNAASAICPVAGRRLWVILATGVNSNNSLRVYDLDLIEGTPPVIDTTSCQVITGIPTIANKLWNFHHTATGDVKKGWGMFWYEPDRSFLLWSCDDMTRDGLVRSPYLRRIKPPLDNDAYDRTGTWTCDEIPMNTTGGFLPDYVTRLGTPSVSGCSFTRFSCLYDMRAANGDALLLSQGAYDTPMYVCRIPNSALPGV